MKDLPLGKQTGYPDHYAPEMLVGIPRRDARAPLGIADAPPFRGTDLWTAWELSWLMPGGKPATAVASVRVPADSPAIVESKSLKLYLGSFAMSIFDSVAGVADRIAGDLEHITGAVVPVELTTPASFPTGLALPPGDCIDDEPVECTAQDVDPTMLRAGGDVGEETLHSHLLRSLCPVTRQPDIGSVVVAYRGPRIDRAGLLRYIVSYRRHTGFHEACVERMFLDIAERCACERLVVSARYNRRGGIDINPYRTTGNEDAVDLRLWRQ